MAITVNLYYTGVNGSARKFAEDMLSSGTVQINLDQSRTAKF